MNALFIFSLTDAFPLEMLYEIKEKMMLLFTEDAKEIVGVTDADIFMDNLSTCVDRLVNTIWVNEFSYKEVLNHVTGRLYNFIGKAQLEVVYECILDEYDPDH
jgi:hypothetical protein